MLRRLLLIATLAGLSACLVPGSAQAITGADWKAGRIIDDSIFTNKASMSVAEIQQFLNSKMTACDTYGQKSVTYKYPFGSDTWVTTTRAIYADRAGNPKPTGQQVFTCLKDYHEVPKLSPSSDPVVNNYGYPDPLAHIPGGAKSAAQIIYDAAQAHNISPKVLLVTLQKEQSMVTDDWPLNRQYLYAMGAHCPDSGPNGTANCDANYASFSLQMHEGASLFRYYLDNMRQSWWPYKKPFQTNNVLWNVSTTGCGGADVYIESMATAALYTYTPYQPNQAALNNLYGTGDGCSAYGNRNFWRMFSDWFGSTQIELPYAWTLEGQEIYSDSARTKRYTSVPTMKPGQKAYLRIKVRNIGNKIWDQSFIRLGTAAPYDRVSPFQDASWPAANRLGTIAQASLTPGQSGTLDLTITAPQKTGTYQEYYNMVAEGQTWLNNFGLYYLINVVEEVPPSNTDNLRLNGGQSLAPGQHLLSADTQSYFIVQGDGNVVLYTNFRPVWSSRTAGSKPGNLRMQSDGNLVLYGSNGVPLWESRTSGNSGAYLTTQTDGNMVVYSSGGAPLWNSGTSHNPDLLAYVNSGASNTTIMPLQRLETQNRSYRLLLQKDGNLVLYTKAGKALWSTNTFGKNVAKAVIQNDGNLVLYSPDGKPVWSAGISSNQGGDLIVQDDGNLVIYNRNRVPLWATNTMQ